MLETKSHRQFAGCYLLAFAGHNQLKGAIPMLDGNDLRSGLDQVLQIPALVDDTCKSDYGGCVQQAQRKFQEALVIATNTQALLLLNLARLALEAGDLALC